MGQRDGFAASSLSVRQAAMTNALASAEMVTNPVDISPPVRLHDR